MTTFKRIELKLYLFFLTCNFFTFAFTNHRRISTNALKYISTLTDSLLHIIIFDGYDIDLSIVSQPVLLLWYYVLYEDLIPVELSIEDSSNNGIQTEKFQNSVDFIGILFEKSLVRLVKNINSEVIVYLHPPNQEASPGLYKYFPWTDRPVLMDPFMFENYRNKWKQRFYNTMSKLSLLICQSGSRDTSKNDHHKETWITSVMGRNGGTRYIEVVQVWETLEIGEHLSFWCPYCNSCKPLQMVDITNDIPTINILIYHNNLLDNVRKVIFQNHPKHSLWLSTKN